MVSEAAVEGVSGALGGIAALVATYPLLTVWHEHPCLRSVVAHYNFGDKILNVVLRWIMFLSLYHKEFVDMFPLHHNRFQHSKQQEAIM